MRYLSSVSAVFIVVFAFITAPTTARPGSIWSVHIDKDPAPPPDEGPPQSAGALRDKSKLKYEIAGIAGGP